MPIRLRKLIGAITLIVLGRDVDASRDGARAIGAGQGQRQPAKLRSLAMMYLRLCSSAAPAARGSSPAAQFA
jgi:hypothetical protein